MKYINVQEHEAHDERWWSAKAYVDEFPIGLEITAYAVGIPNGRQAAIDRLTAALCTLGEGDDLTTDAMAVAKGSES